MKAGRELDGLVAEKVMGWEWDYDKTVLYPPNIHPLGNMLGHQVPLYSTSIEQAWAIVEHLRRKEADVIVEGFDREHIPMWKCEIIDYKGYSHSIKVEDAPCLAICSAALKAVGYQEAS